MKNDPHNTLVVMDFDGTLTYADSMMIFLRTSLGQAGFWRALFWSFPWIIAMKLRIISNETAKKRLLKIAFEGKTRKNLKKMGDSFGGEVLPNLMRPEGLEQIKRYQQAGIRVIIVSASLDIWLDGFMNIMGWEYLSTIADYDGNVFEGNFRGPNNNGTEKVNRLQEYLGDKKYSHIIAYGDTSGDKAMLNWANESHFKPFR